MKKIFLLMLTQLMVGHAMSQSFSNPATFPKMTPPSPDAAALGRYGEYPITITSGTPEVSLPLYEIKSGKLSVPKTLSYHASGVRVNDIASRVGLGWSLMAGGAISRVVKGEPDDLSIGYYNEGLPPEGSSGNYNSCFLARMALGNHLADGQPDDFFYSFNSQNGKFIFSNKQTSGTTPVPITIPFSLMKVQWTTFAQFKITDDDGILY